MTLKRVHALSQSRYRGIRTRIDNAVDLLPGWPLSFFVTTADFLCLCVIERQFVAITFIVSPVDDEVPGGSGLILADLSFFTSTVSMPSVQH